MERIGRYQVERELGRGTMSIVYKAFDPPLSIVIWRSRCCARNLPVTSPQGSAFLREARAAGGLGHPNIVTVFDVGQIDGMPFMAMDVAGRPKPLSDRLEKDNLPTVHETLDIGVQLRQRAQLCP